MLTGPDNPEGNPTLPISLDGSLLEYRRSVISPPLSSTQPIAWFLGTEGGDLRVLQQIWDRLVLGPEEEKVISAMRIIEPTIERLAFASTGRMGESVAFIKLTGEDQRLPLGSLGDGIKRLLAQAIYMARAAGGVLLIDEIDTGLHYSAMESMWRFVIESARRLDVQVFATSHSEAKGDTLALEALPLAVRSCRRVGIVLDADLVPGNRWQSVLRHRDSGRDICPRRRSGTPVRGLDGATLHLTSSRRPPK